MVAEAAVAAKQAIASTTVYSYLATALAGGAIAWLVAWSAKYEAAGRCLVFACVFLCGCATVILLEKFTLIPATCQVTPEIIEASNYRR